MAGAKETPRQKMIGMMYLVLTAMLALNVSTAILKSFLIVNDSIEATNRNFESKILSSYSIFDKLLADNKEKAQENYDKAQEAKRLTEEFRTYVVDTRAELITMVTGLTKEQAKGVKADSINRQDDYDTPTLLFIEQKKGEELRKKIEGYETAMLALIPEDRRAEIRSAFNTQGPFHDASGKEVSWETANFYQSIIVAAITILNKLENDAMNLEYDVVNMLYNLVSAGDFKFESIVAKIIPKSSYVLLGDVFEAEAFIVAFDNKIQTSAVINGQRLNSKDGVIEYKVPTSREGVFTVSGQINLPGNPESFPFRTEYIVAKPTATVSADNMNVLYIGVDNPMSAAGSGEGVEASISGCGGTLTKTGAGSYIARVTTTGEATITLTAKSGGTTKTMGSSRWRVKRVPDPVAVVNGLDQHQTLVDKNVLASSGGLRADMRDFDFKLDTRVSSFTMSTTVGGEFKPSKSNSNRFTEEMLDMIRNARRGQRFIFEDIKCQMPTGMTELRNITLTIR